MKTYPTFVIVVFIRGLTSYFSPGKNVWLGVPNSNNRWLYMTSQTLFDEETIQALREVFGKFPKELIDLLIVESENDPPTGPHEGTYSRHHEHGEHPPLQHITHERGCPACNEAKVLAEELMKTSEGKLKFKIISKNSEEAKKLHVRYVPAFIYDVPKRNIRYYGLPSGQEFAPFIYVHKYIATGEISLPGNVAELINRIDTPLHVKIFVTPECPYCSIVVDALNQMAIINDNLLVETIEAVEHPIEADIYEVSYVPDVIITDPSKQEEYGVEPIERISGYLPPDKIAKILLVVAEKIKKLH